MTTLLAQLTEGVNIYKLFLEESFVFYFSICKCKDQDIQNCNLSVSYGCAVWSLTLKEEQGLQVLENRVLRKIFGPKKGDLTKKKEMDRA